MGQRHYIDTVYPLGYDPQEINHRWFLDSRDEDQYTYTQMRIELCQLAGLDPDDCILHKNDVAVSNYSLIVIDDTVTDDEIKLVIV